MRFEMIKRTRTRTRERERKILIILMIIIMITWLVDIIVIIRYRRNRLARIMHAHESVYLASASLPRLSYDMIYWNSIDMKYSLAYWYQ